MNNVKKIQALLSQGENVGIEFKQADVRPAGLAKEVVAFSNTNGGTILVGVKGRSFLRFLMVLN